MPASEFLGAIGIWTEVRRGAALMKGENGRALGIPALGALGVVAAIVGPMSPGLGWLLAAVIAVMTCWVRRQWCQYGERQIAEAGSLRDGQRQLGERLLPVWSGHIESSLAQMETAVSALATRFGGIVQQIEQTEKSSARPVEPRDVVV